MHTREVTHAKLKGVQPYPSPLKYEKNGKIYSPWTPCVRLFRHLSPPNPCLSIPKRAQPPTKREKVNTNRFWYLLGGRIGFVRTGDIILPRRWISNPRGWIVTITRLTRCGISSRPCNIRCSWIAATIDSR